MRKKLIIIIIVLVGAGALVWAFGLFPLMRVRGEFVLYRVYNERVSALELFESKSRLAAGEETMTPALREEIRKTILQNLVVEYVFQQYIAEHATLSGLEERARAVVAATLKEADPDVLPRATKELYGWSVDEFMENVIFPQALQNELRKEIEDSGASFEEFARMQLTNTQVQFYVVPWKWENGALVEK